MRWKRCHSSSKVREKVNRTHNQPDRFIPSLQPTHQYAPRTGQNESSTSLPSTSNKKKNDTTSIDTAKILTVLYELCKDLPDGSFCRIIYSKIKELDSTVTDQVEKIQEQQKLIEELEEYKNKVSTLLAHHEDELMLRVAVEGDGEPSEALDDEEIKVFRSLRNVMIELFDDLESQEEDPPNEEQEEQGQQLPPPPQQQQQRFFPMFNPRPPPPPPNPAPAPTPTPPQNRVRKEKKSEVARLLSEHITLLSQGARDDYSLCMDIVHSDFAFSHFPFR